MSTANPTSLRVGQSGLLDGRRYTVRGRVVLSVEVDGETYYWQEFNLTDASGAAVTLVFEEVEEGPAWKLFKLFEPLRPMHAGEAAAKRVGDPVEFDGRRARVSLVDQSCVEHIEGQAPEGVERGDVAHYFNADIGDRMFVVSWSGEEVEYFEGGVISARRIEDAFGLPRGAARAESSFPVGASGDDASLITKIVVVVTAVAILGYFGYNALREDYPPSPPPKQVAPASRLPEKANGKIAGHAYTVAGHALIEIARPGRKFDRHEYALVDETGAAALLIQGLRGKPAEWHLFTAMTPAPDFTPYQAALFKPGRNKATDGQPAEVTDLFLSTVLGTDGAGSAAWPNRQQYGFLARVKDTWILARWTETSLQLYQSIRVPDNEVGPAFGYAGQK